MSSFVTGVTLDSFDQLPAHTRRCRFWVLDPGVDAPSSDSLDLEFENEAWLSMIMLEWGSCGQMLSTGGESIGCALYAPPGVVPRASAFPTSPVSADAVLLTTLRVESEVDREDHSAALMQAVVADLVNRGVRALEAFGIRKTADDAKTGPTATSQLTCSDTVCMIDADFLEKMGFDVVAPHHRYPRLRLELDRDHGWKQDVESALERLLLAASLTMVDIEHKDPVGVG
ncbi:GNAT family N-acetyltransferase [Rhodococcus sp. Eu-32]|uniref:GNAT family N-acetyltransferase n=1 Tax=Rhodococcus sp. Eu-32 TaxID=1017319 RepID=UPI000DF1CBE7|nr:GNAT family N-acetyltransferase [Rhodococcus sp. Eu-32]RRQ28428.1 GNAT family N-acetyltransferase [Rhodococcus sp. Eu-32]